MGKKKKISFEDFIKRFDERANGEFEYLDGYEQMSKKIKVKCLKCDAEFEVVATAFVGTDKVKPSECKNCLEVHKAKEYKEKFCKAIAKEGYEMIKGDYKNQNSDITLRHNFCGKEWKTRPAFFIKNGTRCPYCADEGKRRDCNKIDFLILKEELESKYPHIEIIQDIEIKTKNSYVRNIEIKFKECGHVGVRNASSLKSQSFKVVCLECKNNKKVNELKAEHLKRIAKEKNEVFYLLTNIYSHIEKQPDGSYNAIHKCGIKNNIKNVYTHKCICENTQTSNKNAKIKVKILSNYNCELLSEFTGAKNNITILNKKCGHIYDIRFDAFKRSQRCRVCYPVETYRNHPYTINELQDKINERFGEKIIKVVSKNYTNLDTPIDIIHKCGSIMSVTPDHLLNKDSWEYCQNCTEKQSRGEIAIKRYLDKKGYIHIPQFSFNDCRLKLPLRFDFLVLNNDSSIRALIEFDGKQHYVEVDFFADFEYVKQRDEIKNKYCKEKGYKLIRIPYNKLNKIEEILDENL